MTPRCRGVPGFWRLILSCGVMSDTDVLLLRVVIFAVAGYGAAKKSRPAGRQNRNTIFRAGAADPGELQCVFVLRTG